MNDGSQGGSTFGQVVTCPRFTCPPDSKASCQLSHSVGTGLADTSQQSSGAAAAAAAADEVGADDAGGVAGPALVRSTTLASSSESLLSARGCSESACAPTE